MKPIVLCILDGVGIRDEKYGNAVKQAHMPTFNMLLKTYPNSLLEASGSFVGLPDGQMGNSEVGHSNIGAGRILYQPLEMINQAINNKELFQNKNILEVINHTKKNNSKLHICGLLSDGGIHSHIDHLMAIIDMCKENKVKEIYFHIFLDGRDTARDAAIAYIEKLQNKIKETNCGSIATIAGRYYAMDRDNRWDRIKLSYDTMIYGKGKKSNNIKETIEESYKNEIYDEFIEPFIVDEKGTIEDKDGIIVFNYRPDRLRELFTAITNSEFNEFETKKLNDIKLVTMFSVDNHVICKNAFEHQNLENTLGIYLSKLGKKQLRIAETEKYAHVTYFFDGEKELKLDGKEQILIPSPKVATYDLKPEMSAYEITDKLLSELDKDKFDVVILNYANGDMVGHTGNMEATVIALEQLDVCLKKVYDKVKQKKGLLIVTADHGNSDYMIDKDGNPVTTHSTSKVPFIITDRNYVVKNGKLADIAPTILSYMNLDIPKEMTGEILIEKPKESKKEKIFIVLSIIILLAFSINYIYRFITYRNEEIVPPSTEKNKQTLSNKILEIERVTEGNGIHSINGGAVYYGNVTNNYVLYSGILFRIIKVNSDGTVKLITDQNVTSMVYGTGDYESSYIRNYLNDNGLENTGIFYKKLNRPDDYLVASDYCFDKIDTNSIECNKKIKEKVGLLTYNEYINAAANEGYLNTNTYFWLANQSDDGAWYVFEEGGLNHQSHENDTYYSYGVRPVITIKSTVELLGGTGEKEDPYIIDNSSNINVGDYINYSNKMWKIVDIDDEKIKIVLNDYLKIGNEEIEKVYSKTSNDYSTKDSNSIAYYLNAAFYNSLQNQDIILDTTWYNGEYNENSKYNYQSIYNSSVIAKVGLLNVSDFFINDFAGYALMTKASEDMIYVPNSNGSLNTALIDESVKIRPAICISKNISLTGTGTLEDPYMVA